MDPQQAQQRGEAPPPPPTEPSAATATRLPQRHLPPDPSSQPGRIAGPAPSQITPAEDGQLFSYRYVSPPPLPSLASSSSSAFQATQLPHHYPESGGSGSGSGSSSSQLAFLPPAYPSPRPLPLQRIASPEIDQSPLPRADDALWQDTDEEDDHHSHHAAQPLNDHPPESSHSHGYMSDTDERVCRICRCGPEPGQPLYHPCKCAGSIRYSHQDCLKEWLLHSRKSHCELCKHTFAFNKVYSPTMPSVLPLHLQTRFLIQQLTSWVLFGLRAIIVISVWLGFLPWANINFFRGAFWLGDALLWVGGAGTSSWSGVVPREMTRTSRAPPASASARAAPSPTPTQPLQKGENQTYYAGFSNTDNEVLQSLWSFLAPANLRQVLFLPVVGLRKVLSIAQSIQNELSSWDWKTPATWISQDVFQGQILTCCIILLVVSAWFTREWVIMNLPADVPPLLQEEEVAAANAGAMGEEAQRIDADSTGDAIRDSQQELQVAGGALASAAAGDSYDGNGQQDDSRGRLDAAVVPITSMTDNVHADSEAEAEAWSPSSLATAEPSTRRWSRRSSEGEGSNQLGTDDLRTARLARFTAGAASPPSTSPLCDVQSTSSSRKQTDEDRLGEVRNDLPAPLVNTRDLSQWEAGPALNDEAEAKAGGTYNGVDDLSATSQALASSSSSVEPKPELPPDMGTTFDHSYAGLQNDETIAPLAPLPEDSEFSHPSSSSTAAGDETSTTSVDSERSQIGGNPADPAAEDDGNDDGWDSDVPSSASSSSYASEDEGDHHHRNGDDRGRANRRLRQRREDREGAPPPPELAAAAALPRGLLAGPHQEQMRQALEEVLEGPLNANADDADLEELDAAAAVAAADAAADWEEVQGEIQGVMDAVGFRGDPLNLLANLSIVVALCSFFIILFIGVPYFLGRLFGLGAGLIEFVSAPVRLVRLVTDPSFDWLIEVAWKGIVMMGLHGTTTAEVTTREYSSNYLSSSSNLWHSITSRLGVGNTPPTTHKPFWSALQSLAHQIALTPTRMSKDFLLPIEAVLVSRALTTFSQILCVFVGHFWLLAGIAAHIGIGELTKKKKSTAAAGGGWAEDPIGEDRVKDTALQVLTVVKVLAFLCIEIIVFPIGCGIALDICTLPLFAGTMQSRYLQLLSHPFPYVFQLWFIGTLFMFRLGCLISHIRKTLRPGVLSWIRDPEDPDFQPIKEILERRTITHLRKIAASATMYGSLIIVLFGVTCWTLGGLAKGTNLLPLRLGGRAPFIPLDLLCATFVLPALAKMLRPLKRASSISKRWWRFATYHLGIAAYFYDPKHLTAGETNEVDGDTKVNRTFFARVPDSDNSILGSPLMIHVDEAGNAISEKGQEALRVQLEKIARMKDPKAKYTILRLPIGFGRRVKILLAFLWGSLALGAFAAVFLPVVIGRWILGSSMRWHDTYAFCAGLVALSPLILLTILLTHTRAAQLTLDRPSWGGEGKLPGNKRAQRMLRKSLWWTTRSTPLAKKRLRVKLRKCCFRGINAAIVLLSCGVLMPAFVGLTIDQLIIAQVRFSRTQVARTSLPYAWAMGLLELEVFYRVVVKRLTFDWLAPFRDTYRRGLRRADARASLQKVFLPVLAACIALLLSPLLLAEAIDVVGSRVGPLTSSSTPGARLNVEERCQVLWFSRLLVLLCTSGVASLRILVGRMGLLEQELRDQVYLQASELRNYDEKPLASSVEQS